MAITESGPLDELPSLGLVGVEKKTDTRWLCSPLHDGFYRKLRMGHMQDRQDSRSLSGTKMGLVGMA